MRNDLLFAACRAISASARLTEAVDWEYVLRAADRQGIAPLLYEWLRAHPAVQVPREAGNKLHTLYWAQHFRNRIYISELGRVLHAAAAAGLDVIPVKGAVLAVDFYPSPTLRPMSDLDLLVRFADLERMGTLMESWGYRPLAATPSYPGDGYLDEASREHIWRTTRDGLDVIVEYRAAAFQTTAGRLGDLDTTLASALREYTDATWTRAVRALRGSGLRLSREDLLLHGASHMAAQHADFRLIWLHDLARIVAQPPARIDWDYVCASAASLRIAVAAWAALHAAAQWMDAPIPASVLERLRDSSDSGAAIFQRWERRRLRDHVAALGDADLTIQGFAHWPLAEALGRMRGWGARVRTLRWAIFPSHTYLKGYGARPSMRGYITTWARRSVAALARLVAGR